MTKRCPDRMGGVRSSGRGRRIALLSGISGAFVLAASAAAFKDLAVEEWHLLRLRTGREEVRHAAARRLEEMGSLRSIPLVLSLPIKRSVCTVDSILRKAIARQGRRNPRILAYRILGTLQVCPQASWRGSFRTLTRLMVDHSTAEAAAITLVEALKRGPRELAEEAEASLRWIGADAGPAGPVLARYLTDADRAIRAPIVMSLMRIGCWERYAPRKPPRRSMRL